MQTKVSAPRHAYLICPRPSILWYASRFYRAVNIWLLRRIIVLNFMFEFCIPKHFGIQRLDKTRLARLVLGKICRDIDLQQCMMTCKCFSVNKYSFFNPEIEDGGSVCMVRPFIPVQMA